MKNLRKTLSATVFFSLAIVFCAYAEEVKTAETVQTDTVKMPETLSASIEKTTLDNLQAAFNGETNANTRYLAFAQKADEEGYGKVASLFRATARAEQVHFERQAKLIKELGAVPAASVETPVVKSTPENLEIAMKGEIYESTVMYPEFLAKAEKDHNKGAVDVF
jgi:rubrerythrin